MNISCEIANYFGDNHLYSENKCHDVLINVLENDVNIATVLFDNNYVCANPDKFQSIILGRGSKKSLSLSVQDNTIRSDPSIKLLGVTLDDKLKFDEYVSEMCRKALKTDWKEFQSTLTKFVVFRCTSLSSRQISITVLCLACFVVRQISIN